MKRSILKLFGIAAVGAVFLSGCASTYILDNNVQAFSSLTAVPAPPTYRFDRLPSQQEPGQANLEAMADAALHKAGLRRDDANPRLTVQVTGRVQRVLSPWAGDGFMFGAGWGRRSHFGLMSRMDSPWYHREVGLIVREIASNRVVFETHSTNDGPWFDNTEVFPAMFEAALQGFPQPPVGPRVVNVTVGAAQR